MVGVADKHGLCRHDAGLDDLADNAVGVDDGLSVIHTVATADINDKIVLVGIGIHGHDLGNTDFVPDACTGIQQAPQTGVLGLECGESLQASVGEQALGLETAEFEFEFIARCC